MKKRDWYTLYTRMGSKVYVYLAHDRQGQPLLPNSSPGEVVAHERGFDFKFFWHTDRQRWERATRVQPVPMSEHLPSSHLNKVQVFDYVNEYVYGNLGPKNINLELRPHKGEEEIWIHPRQLADFWNRVIAFETKRSRKVQKHLDKVMPAQS